MSCSSARRGQVEPTAALAATFAVVVALGLYAGALDDAMPNRRDRNLAAPTLDRAHAELAPHGIAVDPGAVDRGSIAGPPGHRVNVSLKTARRQWSTGRPVPHTADTASRTVSVELGAGRVRAGTLRVGVWP